MNIQETLKPRIEALGYKTENFNEIHWQAFEELERNNAMITDNLLNPNVDSFVLGMVSSIIDLNPDDQYSQDMRKALPHILPGVNVSACRKLVTLSENPEFMKNYYEVFSNEAISDEKKLTLFKLIEIGAPYQHLVNPAYNEHETKEYYHYQMREKSSMPSFEQNLEEYRKTNLKEDING